MGIPKIDAEEFLRLDQVASGKRQEANSEPSNPTPNKLVRLIEIYSQTAFDYAFSRWHHFPLML